MKTRWFVLSVVSNCIFCSLALAAAYPEIIWLNTYLTPSVATEPDTSFELEPELFRASAIKSQDCALGGTLGCALQ